MKTHLTLVCIFSVALTVSASSQHSQQESNPRYVFVPISATNDTVAFRADTVTGEILRLGGDKQYQPVKLEAPSITFARLIGGEHWHYSSSQLEVRRVLSQLGTVRIPEVDYRQKRLSDVVTELTSFTTRTDSNSVLITCSPRNADIRISLSALDITLSDVLSYLSDIAGCPLNITSHGIEFSHPGAYDREDSNRIPPHNRFMLHILPLGPLLFDSHSGTTWFYSWKKQMFLLPHTSKEKSANTNLEPISGS